jgi:hypothetical protein
MPRHRSDGEIPSDGESSVDSDGVHCSFCGKPREQVDAMVCGPTPAVAICNECVELCTEIVAEKGRPPFDAA